MLTNLRCENSAKFQGRYGTESESNRMFIRYSDQLHYMSTGREIRLIEEDDGWWSAIDEQTGVASQGPTRSEALENLDEAVSVTEAVRGDETASPEPDAPWFEE